MNLLSFKCSNAPYASSCHPSALFVSCLTRKGHWDDKRRLLGLGYLPFGSGYARSLI
ncbi:MAG: hypothetical protein ACR5K9_04340 [Wolbachia sp.]